MRTHRLEENSSFPRPIAIKHQLRTLMYREIDGKGRARAEAIRGQPRAGTRRSARAVEPRRRGGVMPRRDHSSRAEGLTIARGHTMTQGTDVQGLQSKAEARLAALTDEKLVTRIAVLSTSLGQGKTTEHDRDVGRDAQNVSRLQSRKVQPSEKQDGDLFIEMDR
jgi:hypothetical protein